MPQTGLQTAAIAAQAAAAAANQAARFATASAKEEGCDATRKAKFEAIRLRADNAILATKLEESSQRIRDLERGAAQWRARAERAEAQLVSAAKNDGHTVPKVASGGTGTSHVVAATTLPLAAASPPAYMATTPPSPVATPPPRVEKTTSGRCGTAKRLRPAVPSFQKLPTAVLLRQLPLPPAKPEEDYGLSDCEAMSDEEVLGLSADQERSGKNVPAWCDNYLKDLVSQAEVDPDCIFGGDVPACDLEYIFPKRLFDALHLVSERRDAWTEANWDAHGLCKDEVHAYKQRMGQMRQLDPADFAHPAGFRAAPRCAIALAPSPMRKRGRIAGPAAAAVVLAS